MTCPEPSSYYRRSEGELVKGNEVVNDPRSDSEEPLLSVPEVARRANVSTSTIIRIIRAGHLPVARIGRSIRVHPVDLAALLRSRTDSRS